MNSSNQKKLQEIFVIILELDNKVDFNSLAKAHSVNWDSLAHVSLVAAIESEFSLQLDASEIESINSFLETKLLLEEKGC